MELLSGQKHQADRSPKCARPDAEADKDKYQAKIDRYEKEKNEIKPSPKASRRSLTLGQAERRADASASPLGAGDDGAAGLRLRWPRSRCYAKKWLEWGMFAMGGVGVVIGALAVFHI